MQSKHDSQGTRLRVLALPLYGALAASTRRRISSFLPEPSARGIDVEVSPFLDDDYTSKRFNNGSISLRSVATGYWRRIRRLLSQRNYDCVWVQGELCPLLPDWFDRAFYPKYALLGGLQSTLLAHKFERFIDWASERHGDRSSQRAKTYCREPQATGVRVPTQWWLHLRAHGAESKARFVGVGLTLTQLITTAPRWNVLISARFLKWRYRRRPSNHYRLRLIGVAGAAVGVQMWTSGFLSSARPPATALAAADVLSVGLSASDF